jgi:hypothetical protein
VAAKVHLEAKSGTEDGRKHYAITSEEGAVVVYQSLCALSQQEIGSSYL